jgi:hypothetical protein
VGIIGVLDKTPTGRLVVLGEPGAGKTMLAVELVLDLMKRRTPGGPVPVLVSLSSWDPERQDLHCWLERQLLADYPWLRQGSPESGASTTQARALLDRALIMPILDGFDEIPEILRIKAMTRINDSIRLDEGLVLTSRTSAYEKAARPDSESAVFLTGTIGIELCPLDISVIPEYLAGPPGAPSRQRWESTLSYVSDHLDSPLAEVLTTPLFVSLARAIYSPEPGSVQDDAPNPESLQRLPDRVALEEHLFDAFIPAAYRPHPDTARNSRWSPQQAERSLVFLARFMQNRPFGTTDLRLRDFARAIPGWASRLAGAVGVGLMAAVVSNWMLGLTTGLACGLTCGLPVDLPTGDTASSDAHTRWNSIFLTTTLGALAAGVMAGFPIGMRSWLSDAIPSWWIIFGEVGVVAATGIVVRIVVTKRVSLVTVALATCAAVWSELGFAVVVIFGIRLAEWIGFVVAATPMLFLVSVFLCNPEPDTTWLERVGLGVFGGLLVAIVLLVPAIAGVVAAVRLASWRGVGLGVGIGAMIVPWVTVALLIVSVALLGVGLAAGPRSFGVLVRVAFLAVTLAMTATAYFGPHIVFWVWIGVTCIFVITALMGALREVGWELSREDSVVLWAIPLAAAAALPIRVGEFLGQRLAFHPQNSFDRSIGLSLLIGIITAVLYERRLVRPTAVAMAWFAWACFGRVPWRTSAFLDDAHRNRSVLRKVGSVYQFRHIQLQRRLAGRSRH